MHIFKKNEVYLEIKNLEENQKKELLDFFTFEVPNAKFMPTVRNRMWDGKIRLFSPATNSMLFNTQFLKFVRYLSLLLLVGSLLLYTH